MVFGKTGAEEPAFEVLMKHTQGFSYEVRRYGTRYAAEAVNNHNGAFSVLARYIGVFGKPENEAQESIAMTAPVVKETKSTPIAMTAPVVKTEDSQGNKVMQFMLPAKYDSLSKIPKPTNSAVQIREIAPATGAVHRYSGSYSEAVTRQKVTELALQLQQDGVEGMTEEYAMENHLWFGYNPPFTLPPLRRIEVWLPLSPEQVGQLLKGLTTSGAN